MTVYSINQAGYASLPNMEEKDVEHAKSVVTKFLREVDSNYYMLLNNEKRYYTMFERVTKYPVDITLSLCNEIFSIAQELGTLKSVELNDTMSAIEFWIVDETGQCNMYILFDYSRGVIRV